MHAVPLNKCGSSDKQGITDPTLVLGIGNILQKDDGVGVHVVNSLIEEKVIKSGRAEIIDGGTAGYDLISVMSGRKKILIVDALKTDATPGSIYRFPASHLKTNNTTYSLHDMGVKRLLDMLSLMGEEPDIEIIGIAAEDISSFEIGLSESLIKAVPEAVKLIADIINK